MAGAVGSVARVGYLNRSQTLKVVRLYTAFLAARFGSRSTPMPFFPYPGDTLLLRARLDLPVVRAFKERVREGVRMPNFIVASLPRALRGVKV